MNNQLLYLLFISSLLLGTNSMTAQEEKSIVEGFQLVRTHALSKAGTATEDLQIRKERLIAEGFTKKQVNRVFSALWHGAMLYDMRLKSMKKRVSPEDDPENIFPLFEKIDYELVVKNDPVMRLIDEGAIKPNPPHDLVPKDSAYLLNEFLFYQFEDGMQIGEIGAGSGIISLLLGVIYNDLTIYVNEVENDKVDYIKQLINTSDLLHASNKIIPVKGKYSSTALEGKELDVLLLRDVFHHFSEMETMLNSMKASLKNKGQVILIEVLPELDTDGNCCKDAMPRSELVSVMSKNGFTLIDQRDFLETAFLKFQKND
jgi:SAM-dependent methyltransferase